MHLSMESPGGGTGKGRGFDQFAVPPEWGI